MESIRRYFRRTDKIYLLMCVFSSAMAVAALSSWAAKQGNGFAVDEVTGQMRAHDGCVSCGPASEEAVASVAKRLGRGIKK